jgi:hypothetical protein
MGRHAMDKRHLAMTFFSAFGWLATFYLIYVAVSDWGLDRDLAVVLGILVAIGAISRVVTGNKLSQTSVLVGHGGMLVVIWVAMAIGYLSLTSSTVLTVAVLFLASLKALFVWAAKRHGLVAEDPKSSPRSSPSDLTKEVPR